ncbi:MAG: hypothetical protein ACLU4B_01680 [Bilophila wadsworthia]
MLRRDLFHFWIIHGLDDDVASGKQSTGRRAIKTRCLPQDDGRIQFRKTAPSASTFGNPKCRGEKCWRFKLITPPSGSAITKSEYPSGPKDGSWE